MLRLFVGIPLPESYQQALTDMRRRWEDLFRSKLGWTRQGNWHVTLKFLGDVDPGRVDAVADALSGIRFSSFPMCAGGAGGFPDTVRPRVLWVGLREGEEACRQLAATVEDSLAPLGFAPEKRPFSPHLTIARIKKYSRDPFEEAVAGMAATDWEPFRVDRFVLWRSILGVGGPVYTPLAEVKADDAGR